MSEVIAFADAEAMAVSWLKQHLPDTHVATAIPRDRPDRLVKVTRVGGSKIRLNADSPMLVFECWDSTSTKASDLCRLVRAYVHAMAGESIGGTWVYRVREVGGSVSNPDPNTTNPRYQMTVTVDTKGETL